MFTDDPFLLTGILMAAMIPLYILILKKLKPSQALAKAHTMNNPEKHNLKTKKKNNKIEKKDVNNTQPEKPKHVCSHTFGYLSALPKNASIPSECLGCPQIIECLTNT
jgi:uncharacterized Zn finger protein